MKKKSVRAAVCGLAAALSVTIMLLGGLLYIFAYVAPMLLGLVCVMIKKTLGAKDAVLVYAATSILSLILVPEKESVLMFALFFGYYPIIKSSLDKLKIKPLRFLLKLLIFNASIAVIELLCVFVFNIPFFEDGVFSYALLIGFAAAMNFTFIMYDYLLKIFLVLYEKKIEKRITKYLK